MAVAWIFCCGVFSIFWIIGWIAIWISASYFTIITMQKIRATVEEKPSCDVTLIVVSGISTIIAWTALVLTCCFAGYSLFNRNKPKARLQRSKEKRHTGQNIYDSVPQEFWSFLHIKDLLNLWNRGNELRFTSKFRDLTFTSDGNMLLWTSIDCSNSTQLMAKSLVVWQKVRTSYLISCAIALCSIWPTLILLFTSEALFLAIHGCLFVQVFC